jgi:pyruvate dehydrogenase complex dehydrogenase (E1) component
MSSSRPRNDVSDSTGTVSFAALWQLAKKGQLKAADVTKAIRDFGIDPETADPTTR